MNDGPDAPIYLGTMSGTSLDGLDVAAVKFHAHDKPELLASHYTPYPAPLKQELSDLIDDKQATVNKMSEVDIRLGHFYAQAVANFIDRYDIPISEIAAVGSHGQTLRHAPHENPAYTLQIGDPNVIAAKTGLTVVADFRRRDIALGGQGAPLAPAFHACVFGHNQNNRIILNIGGIANITLLAAGDELPVLGFDTGPGNTLLDLLSRRLLNKSYDSGGEFAALGKVDTNKLNSVINDEPYFKLAPPKSTGTDYFSARWLRNSGILELNPADAMATVAELVVVTIADAINQLDIKIDECFVCGGGAHNEHLMKRLKSHLPEIKLDSTAILGADPDYVEAIAFAWLAKQTLEQRPGNVPSVTNAQKFTILGAVYYSHGQR